MRRNWSWINVETEEDWSGDQPMYHVVVSIRHWHPGFWWACVRMLWADRHDDDGESGYVITRAAIERAVVSYGKG